MRILMFSMERGLLGERVLGDAVERHRRYAEVELSKERQVEELNIVVFAKKGYKKEQLSDKVFVYPTDSGTRFSFFWDAYKIGKQIYKDSPFELVIGDFLTGFSAWLIRRKFKINFLMHFHGDFWGNRRALEGKPHNWFLLLLSKFLARRADGIRVVSSGIKKSLVKRRVDKKKIKVINTPTSIHLIDNPDKGVAGKIREKYKNKKVILFIGRLEKVKNVDWLIRVFGEIRQEWSSKTPDEDESFRRGVDYKNTKTQFVETPRRDNSEYRKKADIQEVNYMSNKGNGASHLQTQEQSLKSKIAEDTDCVLAVIGDGSQRKNLENLVDRLNLKGDVFFEGKIGVDKWKNYFQAASMLVLPSLSESFGNVLALAGAAGLPVTASRTTGARDIVQDKKTGFLVPINNKKKFKQAILDLLNNDDKAREMGETARKYCRDKFDPEKTTRRIVEWWWEIVAPY